MQSCLRRQYGEGLDLTKPIHWPHGWVNRAGIRNNYDAEQRDHPFRLKHDKPQSQDFCMSGIRYFKNKDR